MGINERSGSKACHGRGCGGPQIRLEAVEPARGLLVAGVVYPLAISESTTPSRIRVSTFG
jgi:hypothetical protein